MNRQLFAGREAGATLVEVGIVAPVLLLAMLALVELSLAFFTTLTMQHAVREGARYAVTGQNGLDPHLSEQQRHLAVIQKMRDSSLGLYDKLGSSISINGTRYTGAGFSKGMFGGANDLVVLRLDCDWTVTTPLLSSFFTNGKYHFAVAATMRNEAFP